MSKDNENNGQNLTKFEPTLKQLKLLETYLDPDVTPSVTAICEKADVSRTTYYEWMKDETFCKWFWDEFNKHITHVRAHLVKIGIAKAKSDHRYWADMMRRLELLEGQFEAGIKKAGESAMETLYHLMTGKTDGEKEDG